MSKRTFMAKTVGADTLHSSIAVQPESLWQTLRWIHFDQPEEDFNSLLRDLEPRLRTERHLPPLEIMDGYKRIAAAYFINLNGSVATLGGLRALRGYEHRASKLLEEFCSLLEQQQIQQIQALVDVTNLTLNLILQDSIFHHASTVKHLWLEVPKNPIASVGREEGRLSWRPAASFPFSECGQLLEATFKKTLDCPALNGLRSGEEVLKSFLDDQDHDWDNHLTWQILCFDAEPIGCSLLNLHPRQVAELVYIGLVEPYRGRGYGQLLVEKAIQSSQVSGAELLVTAVDSQNWPATNIYQSMGFHEHRELAVWLPSRIKISTRIVA
jgi:GNAT superfamily N-acetyltransferase